MQNWSILQYIDVIISLSYYSSIIRLNIDYFTIGSNMISSIEGLIFWSLMSIFIINSEISGDIFYGNGAGSDFSIAL